MRGDLMKAIILAGGTGTRLRPFTEALPKPMLPIGYKPILEILIEYLKSNGFDEIILAIHYLSDSITHYFEDGSRFGIKISYSKEEQLLGTAGAVKKAARDLNETFVVLLGDGLSDINYSKLLEFHRRSDAICTMVVFTQSLKVPYGVLNLDINGESSLLGLEEKPELTFKVNTGIMVLEPKSLDYLDDGEFLNMTDLLLKLKDIGEKVIVYHHDGNWVDVGQDIQQYLQINKKIIEKKFKFSDQMTKIIFGDVRDIYANNTVR